MKQDGSRNQRRTGRRRVAVVTGTRAEYGLLQSTMEAITRHPKLTLQTVVTGMHLIRKFGLTIRQIERDGWRIDARVPMQRGDDDSLDQARGLSRGIAGISAYLEQARTDIVLVLGDRIEAMAGALAATTTGRFLAHIHGGDVASGDTDDILRHSLTKLAHIHLAATKEAARRIIRLGERSEQVHVVGAPGLDRLFTILRESPELRRNKEDVAVIVQHACGRRPAVEARAMSAVLQAVKATGLKAVALYPNTDRGHTGIISALTRAQTRSNGNGWLRVARSLDRDSYLRLLIGSRVLVGNSSSGIIEAAAAGTPAVNVGDRQAGRLRAGNGILDAGESVSGIRRALSSALTQRPKKRGATPYGQGGAGERIAQILAQCPLGESLRRKSNML